MAAANGVAALIAGRLVVGIGIGISAVVTPAYLGEMAPSRVRGAVVMTYEVMLCVGSALPHSIPLPGCVQLCIGGAQSLDTSTHKTTWAVLNCAQVGLDGWIHQPTK